GSIHQPSSVAIRQDEKTGWLAIPTIKPIGSSLWRATMTILSVCFPVRISLRNFSPLTASNFMVLYGEAIWKDRANFNKSGISSTRPSLRYFSTPIMVLDLLYRMYSSRQERTGHPRQTRILVGTTFPCHGA